jgi:hypothetical protein
MHSNLPFTVFNVTIAVATTSYSRSLSVQQSISAPPNSHAHSYLRLHSTLVLYSTRPAIRIVRFARHSTYLCPTVPHSSSFLTCANRLRPATRAQRHSTRLTTCTSATLRNTLHNIGTRRHRQQTRTACHRGTPYRVCASAPHTPSPWTGSPCPQPSGSAGLSPPLIFILPHCIQHSMHVTIHTFCLQPQTHTASAIHWHKRSAASTRTDNFRLQGPPPRKLLTSRPDTSAPHMPNAPPCFFPLASQTVQTVPSTAVVPIPFYITLQHPAADAQYTLLPVNAALRASQLTAPPSRALPAHSPSVFP